MRRFDILNFPLQQQVTFLPRARLNGMERSTVHASSQAQQKDSGGASYIMAVNTATHGIGLHMEDWNTAEYHYKNIKHIVAFF